MVSVIASSIRKGNVVEKEGKLYVVIRAENIHPGKGTPVTHLEMRRISDGVKTNERYRTTDSVEKAFIDEGSYNFLYQDGEHYVFMEPTTFEQIHVSGDIVGDGPADGEHGSLNEPASGRADLVRPPAWCWVLKRARRLRRPPLRSSLPCSQRRAHHWCRRLHAGTRGRQTGDGAYLERARTSAPTVPHESPRLSRGKFAACEAPRSWPCCYIAEEEHLCGHRHACGARSLRHRRRGERPAKQRGNARLLDAAIGIMLAPCRLSCDFGETYPGSLPSLKLLAADHLVAIPKHP